MKRKVVLAFLLVFIISFGFAQQEVKKIGKQEYEQLKKAGQLNPKIQYQFNKPVSKGGQPNSLFKNIYNPGNQVLSGNCGTLPPLTYTTVVYDFFGSPDSIGDDGSTTPIALPFNFCFYGVNYNSVYINSNGNITFVSGQTSFSSTGFPNNTDVMIAPLWADFDNNPGLSGNSNGYTKISLGPNYMVVKW